MIKYKYFLKKTSIFILIIAFVVTGGIFTGVKPVRADTSFTLTAVQAEPNTDTQINLSWKPVADAQYYILYRNNQQIKYIDINSTRDYLSYTDTDLIPETTYTYMIIVRDKYSQQIGSATATCTTSKMRKPTGLWFSYNPTNRTVTLYWTNNSKATIKSIIQRTDGSYVSTVWGSSSNGTFTDYVYDTNSSLGYVVISADNYGHTSEPSLPVYINSSTVQRLPEIYAYIKNGAVTIEWEANSLSIGYVMLERSVYRNGYWSNWEVVNSDVNYEDSIVTDTPEKGGTYRYRLYIYALEAQGYTNISAALTKPVAPKDLNCSFSSSNNVLLSWTNDIYNDCKLRIERKDPFEDDYHVVAYVESNVSYYNDTSAIKPNSTYYYRISAYDSDENYATSEPAAFSTNPPESPSYLRMTVLSENQIYLMWNDNSNNEQNFRIERSINHGDFSVIATVTANTTYYTDNTVYTGYTYSYRVRAYNPYGYSNEYTNIASATSSAVITPPQSLNANVVSSEQIDLTWSYAGNTNPSTIIERRTGTNGKWTEIANIAAGVTKYSDTGLQPDTTYYYRIRAAGGAYLLSTAYPSDSGGVSARTMLKKPINLSGYASSQNTMVLTWDSSNQVNEYVIERKTGSGDFSVVAYGTYYNKTWTDTELNPNTIYTYRVQAKNPDNFSEYSDEVVVITKFIEPPSELKASAVSDSKVELTWKDNSTSEAGFEIWRKTGKEGTWQKIASPRYTSKFSDTTAKAGTEYYYKVRAYALLSDGTAYTSAFTKEVQVKTEMPPAPVNVEASILSSDKVELKWEGPDDANIEFKVERMTDSSTVWKEVASLPGRTFTYIDTGLVEYVTYIYRIKAVNTLNNSVTASDSVSIMTGAPEMPVNVTAKALSPYSIGIYWDDVSNAELGYIIERKGSDGKYVQIAVTDKDATSYIDEGLTPGVQYYYSIRSYNKSGSSDITEVHASTYMPVTFSDITNISWAKNEIEYMAAAGLMEGKTNTLFKPYDEMTRAEFVSLLIKALNLRKVPVGSFADVNITHWAYNELMIAKNLGIISGDSKNYFYPDNIITREEMAIIVTKAMKAAGKPIPGYATSVLDKYTDASEISSEALYNMASLEGAGILPDKGSAYLKPKGGLTRAEAAVIVYRLIFMME